jgi:queuine/archaeosine tRNA-ribosyltransferase
MSKEVEEAIAWAEECIKGHRRSKKEIMYLTILLNIIREEING